MKNKEDRFFFGEHALKRGLERMVDKFEPYTQHDYDQIKKLILKNMEWNELAANWELRDWGLEFVIRDSKVVTISPLEDKNKDVTKIRRITEFHKLNQKKYMRLGRTQNSYKKN